MAEKIYLQIDNKVYTTDQAIWFKAIVVNAAYHIPSQLSGVLYAELIDPNKNIVERKLIKIEEGIGNSFFQLSPAYVYGVYEVRAYTEWDKNFDQDFFFKEYIQVSGPEKQAPFHPIQKLTIIEGQRNERRLNVEVDPALSDSISGKAIKFILEANEKKDTLSLKRNRSNQYLLNYIIPAQCELLSVQLEMDHGINYAKTIVIDTNYIDLQFFPESGELVQGLPALLGFKALDYEGRGRRTEGEIINAKGDVISSFQSNELGMGSVNLGIADTVEKYVARVLSNTGSFKTYSLPHVAGRGNNLSLKRNGDKITLRASSNYLKDDSIAVRASCRGINYFDFKGKLKNSIFEFAVDGNILPEGIINFTLLLPQSITPLAERLYFNKKPGERMRIAVSSDKKEYAQRGKTTITITTSDTNGRPIPANISLLAFTQPPGNAADFHQNILSFFLLSSDLRGEIENPGYYFAGDADKSNDLDVLLLTQGWRKYIYPKVPIQTRFQAETGLTLSGNVKGGISDNKIIKGAELTMMAFSKPPFVSAARADSLGRFRFLMDDEYGDNLDVVIQSANKSNKKRQYLITLDNKEPPPVIFNNARLVQKPDSVVQAYIQQSIKNKKIADDYRLAKEGVTMQEVIVKTRILSPQQKLVTEKYGKPNVIIDGKDIQAKEQKWSYGLYSVLMFQFPEKVNVTRYGNGFLYASLYNSEPTLVVIDGIPVMSYEYNLVPGISTGEVKSFELIPYAKNFRSLFCEAISCGFNTPSVGNVIAIYTYAGKGLYGVRPPTGVSKMVAPVFSKPREFYTPRYEQVKAEDWKRPDLRTLVHWDPKLRTDTAGRSLVSFYNSDNSGVTRVVVEAISENGEIGYAELWYDVRKRNLEGTSP